MIDDDQSTAERASDTRRGIRGEILESWRRSQRNGVDRGGADPVEGTIDVDWRVSRIAIPVLESTAQMLIGSNTSLLLSAPDGTLLWRWDEDSSLKHLLDRNSAVVGTRWSEDVIGTNGLGTALETSKPIMVSGAEHYCEALHPFTCAGAPIRHPVTRRVTGVLSVTSLVKDASPLMSATLLRLAHDVEDELYGDSSQHEREMLQHFLTERRRLRAAVVAVSPEVFIANAAAAGLPLDRADLWRRIESDPDTVVGWRIGDDCTVTAMRPVMRGTELVGAVLVAAEPAAASPHRSPSSALGSWDALVPTVRRTLQRRRRVLITGESGVGKRRLAQRALSPDGAVAEIDCTAVDEVGVARWLSLSRSRLEQATSVLISRIDMLDDRVAHALAAIVDAAAPPDTRVAATLAAGGTRTAGPRALQDRFPPDVVEIPPLRKRTDDIRQRLSAHRLGQARLTRRATDALLQYPWPGNDRQLDQFRRWLADQPRAIVDVGDLPAEWSPSRTRRGLSTIQLAESDAIAEALRVHEGNKSAAAGTLGISRSSLYRKMREYHLTAG